MSFLRQQRAAECVYLNIKLLAKTTGKYHHQWWTSCCWDKTSGWYRPLSTRLQTSLFSFATFPSEIPKGVGGAPPHEPVDEQRSLSTSKPLATSQRLLAVPKPSHLPTHNFTEKRPVGKRGGRRYSSHVCTHPLIHVKHARKNAEKGKNSQQRGMDRPFPAKNNKQ